MCRSETPIFSCLLDRDPNAPGHLTGHSIYRPERYRMQCYPTRPFLFSLLLCVCVCVFNYFYFFDGGVTIVIFLFCVLSCVVCCSQTIGVAAEKGNSTSAMLASLHIRYLSEIPLFLFSAASTKLTRKEFTVCRLPPFLFLF